MHNRLLAALAPILLLAATDPSHAAGMTGSWTGEFHAVRINTLQVGQGGSTTYRPSEAPTSEKAQMTTSKVTVTVEMEEEGLLHGRWGATAAGSPAPQGGEFVCAETSPKSWHCVDRTGTTLVEVLMGGNIRICHFENGSNGQVAGCGLLFKAG